MTISKRQRLRICQDPQFAHRQRPNIFWTCCDSKDQMKQSFAASTEPPHRDIFRRLCAIRTMRVDRMLRLGITERHPTEHHQLVRQIQKFPDGFVPQGRCFLLNRCPVRFPPRLCENSEVGLGRRTFVSNKLNKKRRSLSGAVEKRKERKQFCTFSARRRFHTACTGSRMTDCMYMPRSVHCRPHLSFDSEYQTNRSSEEFEIPGKLLLALRPVLASNSQHAIKIFAIF